MEKKAHQTMMRQREARKKRAQAARAQDQGGLLPLDDAEGAGAGAEGHGASTHGKYNELLSRYTSLLDRVFPLHSMMVHMPDAETLRRCAEPALVPPPHTHIHGTATLVAAALVPATLPPSLPLLLPLTPVNH